LIVFLDVTVGDKIDLNLLPPSCLPFVNTDIDYIGSHNETTPLFQHCRVRATASSLSASGTPARLEAFAATLRNFDPPSRLLSRLSLPSTLRALPLALDYALSSAATDHVVAACESKGVEVVFEDGEEKLGGSFLPLSTVEYAKKLRAEQAAAGGA
jgi:hypothetical protein